MSREAPFLIDDLLPPGVRLLGISPVNCGRIPRATSVLALAVGGTAEGGLERLSALSGTGRPTAVLIAAEGKAAADAAVAALDGHDLPGLVLRIEARSGFDWIVRLQALARRIAPAAAVAPEADATPARRYVAKMRELEELIDPGADAAERDSERRPDLALNWHSRLHARAVARFLRRQGVARTGKRPVWERLGSERAAQAPGREDLAREEALLDRLIADERARRAAMVLPAPWRGRGRLPGALRLT